jgi:uncharacterized protein (DUF433 family)
VNVPSGVNEVELPLTAEAVPLVRLPNGSVRLRGTRVGLEQVVADYEGGMSPEQMVRTFDTLDLADVYSVIGYYLRHKPAVRAYMAREDELAAELRRWVEAHQRPQPTREELLARLAARRGA